MKNYCGTAGTVAELPVHFCSPAPPITVPVCLLIVQILSELNAGMVYAIVELCLARDDPLLSAQSGSGLWVSMGLAVKSVGHLNNENTEAYSFKFNDNQLNFVFHENFGRCYKIIVG